MEIIFQASRIQLLNDHAVFLPDESALIMADIHLGKAIAFQAHGLNVPDGDSTKDLKRISFLLEKTQAQRLIIAGDLLHAPSGNSPQLLEQLALWMQNCPAELTLVIGNHDKRALPDAFTSKCKTVHIHHIGPFCIVHDPDHIPLLENTLFICGHIHPVIRINDGNRTAIRSACFWFSGKSLILPSFGTFTGGQIIRPKKGERIFVPLHERVVEIPETFWKKH